MESPYRTCTGKIGTGQKLNALLDNFRASITQHYREVSDREVTVTAEKVRNAFLGIQCRNETLLDLFNKHTESLRIQIGKKDVSRDSYQKYVRTATRLEDFMKSKYNISDISLKEIKHSFLYDFEVYLKTNYGCWLKHNYQIHAATSYSHYNNSRIE